MNISNKLFFGLNPNKLAGKIVYYKVSPKVVGTSYCANRRADLARLLMS